LTVGGRLVAHGFLKPRQQLAIIRGRQPHGSGPHVTIRKSGTATVAGRYTPMKAKRLRADMQPAAKHVRPWYVASGVDLMECGPMLVSGREVRHNAACVRHNASH
jgi:hypothetical protein